MNQQEFEKVKGLGVCVMLMNECAGKRECFKICPIMHLFVATNEKRKRKKKERSKCIWITVLCGFQAIIDFLLPPLHHRLLFVIMIVPHIQVKIRMRKERKKRIATKFFSHRVSMYQLVYILNILQSICLCRCPVSLAQEHHHQQHFLFSHIWNYT